MSKVIRRTITLTLIESWTIRWVGDSGEDEFASRAGESQTRQEAQEVKPRPRAKWEIVAQRRIVEWKIVESEGSSGGVRYRKGD